MTRTWPFALLLALLPAALLMGALAFAQYTPEAAVEHGRTLFTGTCASCHGVSGQGAGMPGLGIPRLDAQGTAWRLSDIDLTLIIRNGKGVMPGVGSSWTEEDLGTVLALLKSWWTPEQQQTHEAVSKAQAP